MIRVGVGGSGAAAPAVRAALARQQAAVARTRRRVLGRTGHEGAVAGGSVWEPFPLASCVRSEEGRFSAHGPASSICSNLRRPLVRRVCGLGGLLRAEGGTGGNPWSAVTATLLTALQARFSSCGRYRGPSITPSPPICPW
ncbi:hypothetical protein VPH35_029284 [Triticum aestivum]